MEDVVFTILGTAEVAEHIADKTGEKWDSKKVAKYLGRAREREDRTGSFPEPDVTLACGNIWLDTTIDEYLEARG